MNIDYKIIGARIKEIRRQRGLTQDKLAEALDVSVGYISQVERGITKISLDLLGALSGILMIDPAFFVSQTVFVSSDYRSEDSLRGYEKLSIRDKMIINRLIQAMLEE